MAEACGNKVFIPLNIVIDMDLHNELFGFRMHHSKTPMSESRAWLALSPSPPMQICADCIIEVNLKLRNRVASLFKSLSQPVFVTHACDFHVIPFSGQICSARFMWSARDDLHRLQHGQAAPVAPLWAPFIRVHRLEIFSSREHALKEEHRFCQRGTVG